MKRGTVLVASLALLTLLLFTSAGAPLTGGASGASSGFVFSASGDFGSWHGFDQSLLMLKRSSPTFALALGDLSYGGETEQKWCSDIKGVVNNVAILAGAAETGEHNLSQGDINAYIQYCPFTLGPSAQGVYGKQYAFDYPASNPIARFILISPDLRFLVDDGEHYNYSAGTPRYNWTRDEIDGARAAGIPWVIVAMYKNCIGTGEHPCETGTDILNLLVDRKVDLILQTRTHGYERSRQLALNATACPAIQKDNFNAACVANQGLDGRYTKGDGSVLVISGTGGRDFETFAPSDPDTPWFVTAMDNSTPGAGKGVVTFDVTATAISMHTEFNGTFTDSFTIASAAGTTGSLSFPPILVIPLVAAPVAVAVAGVLVVRSRKRRKQAPDAEDV